MVMSGRNPVGRTRASVNICAARGRRPQSSLVAPRIGFGCAKAVLVAVRRAVRVLVGEPVRDHVQVEQPTCVWSIRTQGFAWITVIIHRFRETGGVPDDPSASRDQDPEASGVAAADSVPAVPGWFEDFLIDRGTRKPSAHTVKAYRQDFHAIATLVAGGAAASFAPAEITADAMRRAFASFAACHEPASIRRCWSTWNVLCEFLFTGELIPSNPMPLVGRPKASPAAPNSSHVRVIAKDLAAELGGQGGQPFRVSQKLLLALANDRLEESLQSGRRHQG